MTDVGRLSGKKLAFLEALLVSTSVRDAAKQAGVAERTATRWLADPLFSATLVAAKQEAFNEALDLLRVGAKAAITTLAASMRSDNPHVRLRAASLWLTAAVELFKMSQIEERFTELERLLKASGLARGV